MSKKLNKKSSLKKLSKKNKINTINKKSIHSENMLNTSNLNDISDTKNIINNNDSGEIIVSQDEIDKEILKEKSKFLKKEKVIAENISKIDDQPSWYHYLIILFIMFAIFAGFYYTFELYDTYFNEDIGADKLKDNGLTFYDYPYKIANTTYNIKFHYPIDIMDNYNVPIELGKLEFLNTINLTRSFLIYNGTDNGEVAVSASFLYSFVKGVYRVSFNENVQFSEINCSNSTILSKVIVFNPYSNRSGVFYNQRNGCIEFESNRVEDFVLLTNKFIYEIISE